MVETNETGRDFQITQTSRKRSLYYDVGAAIVWQYFMLDALEQTHCGPHAQQQYWVVSLMDIW